MGIQVRQGVCYCGILGFTFTVYGFSNVIVQSTRMLGRDSRPHICIPDRPFIPTGISLYHYTKKSRQKKKWTPLNPMYPRLVVRGYIYCLASLVSLPVLWTDKLFGSCGVRPSSVRHPSPIWNLYNNCSSDLPYVIYMTMSKNRTQGPAAYRTSGD